MPDELVNVRYMVDDVEDAVVFYSMHFRFRCAPAPPPRSPTSRAATCGCCSAVWRARPGGRCLTAARRHRGGWNRIHFIVDDIAADVERLRAAGATFRNDIVSGPGGQRILLETPPATRSSSACPPAPDRWSSTRIPEPFKTDAIHA